MSVDVPAQTQTQAQTKSQPSSAPAQAPLAPEPGPVPGGASPAQEPPPPSSSRPGLLETIGDLIKESAQGAQKSIENLNEANRNNVKAATDAAKGAVEGLPRLPGTRMVSGRVVCAVAANGAPDCKAGSDKLCHDKGFGNGTSLATETAQNCPIRAYLPGRSKDGECRMDTYVTQAICQ